MHLGRKAKVPELEMYSFKHEQLAKKCDIPSLRSKRWFVYSLCKQSPTVYDKLPRLLFPIKYSCVLIFLKK